MKKFIKILGVFLGIILCFHNLCYADVITITPIDGLAAGSMLLLPVGIIVFIIIMISYISLKVTAKKEENQGQINEDTQKKIEKDKKYLSICIFVLTIMISTIICMLNRRYFPWICMIPVIILLIIAINYRAKENKKVAYILYAIAVAIFAITCIYGNNVENKEKAWKERGGYSESELEAFNSKITPYLGESVTGSKVNALIQYVISNNIICVKSGETNRSISITFPGNSSGITVENSTVSYGTNIRRVETGLEKYYRVVAKYDHGLIKQIIVTEKH